MQIIYKEFLSQERTQEILIPKGSTVLSVQNQHGSICLWYLNTMECEYEKHEISYLPTGSFFEHSPGRFIDTVQIYGGDETYHVFDRIILE